MSADLEDFLRRVSRGLHVCAVETVRVRGASGGASISPDGKRYGALPGDYESRRALVIAGPRQPCEGYLAWGGRASAVTVQAPGWAWAYVLGRDVPTDVAEAVAAVRAELEAA